MVVTLAAFMAAPSWGQENQTAGTVDEQVTAEQAAPVNAVDDQNTPNASTAPTAPVSASATTSTSTTHSPRPMVVKNYYQQTTVKRHTVVRRVGLGKRGHRALWREDHKAGVVSRTFIEARDNKAIAVANTYTDNAVAGLSLRTWLAIVLSLIAIGLGLYVGWWRLPRWNTVYY
jgi:hypothetical protein